MTQSQDTVRYVKCFISSFRGKVTLQVGVIGRRYRKIWHLASRVPRDDFLSFRWQYTTELLSEGLRHTLLGKPLIFLFQEKLYYKTDEDRSTHGKTESITQNNIRKWPVMSEEWSCDRSPWSLPLKFQQLNNHNSTKDFLLSAQICLRDPYSETSKGGQVGANGGSEKSKKLRWAMDSALQPRVHNKAQPDERRNQIVAILPSARRSKEIQWPFLQEWAVVAVAEPSDQGRDKHKDETKGVWQLALLGEKQSHSCLPSLPRAYLSTTFMLGCQVHYLQTQELVLQKKIFHEQRCTLGPITGWVEIQGGFHRGPKSSLLVGQSNKEGKRIPPAHPTLTNCSCTAGSISLRR